MKKVVVFDTAIGTGNQGDDIIYNSIIDEMGYILDKSYIMRYGTHVMNYSPIQMMRMNKKDNDKLGFCNESNYKFICGTNLISHSLKSLVPQWQLNPFNTQLYKDSILIGVGSTRAINEINKYTKKLYSQVLSHKYIHSVRDEQTKERLTQLGFKAINTGCPTLWCMSAEKCARIPTKKSDKVVFTLSGHKHLSDRKFDQQFIDIIKKNYKKVWAWIQTIKDEEYIDSLDNTDNIEKIYSLNAYSKLLKEEDVDYVGTRLHGGIYAMQHEKRSIIVIIDHRAKGVYETNKINAIYRENVPIKLEELINSEIITNVVLPEKDIQEWKSQFIL